MNNRAVASGFLGAGLMSWIAPEFSGFFFDSTDVTTGEGRIIGAIFLVGAALVWFKQG